MKYTPKELQSNVNVSHTSPLKEFFLLLAGALGILIVLYVVLGFAVDLVVPRLPPGIEQHLGNLYAAAFANQEQTPAEKHLQVLLDDLVNTSSLQTRTYYVHLVPSSQANAFALPGGHIVILSELIEELDSENELAFILAHELGHFANRDHLRGLGRGLVLTAISTFVLGGDNTVTNLLMNSLLTIEMKFSQRQETQADLFALDLLNAHYGHIAGATDFFEKISKEDTRSRLAYFFATHPYPPDRVARLQDHIQTKEYAYGEKYPLDETLTDLSHNEESGKNSLREIFEK